MKGETLQLATEQLQRERVLHEQRPRLAYVGIRTAGGTRPRRSAKASAPAPHAPSRVLRRVFPNRLARR